MRVLLQQDDVGGLAGDVDGGVHGDAAVALAHGGGVVHAVAHEAHGVAQAAQNPHDTGLLGGGELGKDAGLLHARGELLVAEALDLLAGEHAVHGMPMLRQTCSATRAESPVRTLVATPCAASARMASAELAFGRVEKRQVADEGHLALVLHGQGAGAGRVGLAGHAQHAHALVGQGLCARGHAAALLVRERPDAPVDLDVRADGQDLLDGPLADHAGLPLGVTHHHGEAAALEVKRQLVHGVPTLGQLLCAEPGATGVSSVPSARARSMMARSMRFFTPVEK